MEIEKKKIAIIILAVILITSGIGNVLLTLLVMVEPPESGEILKVARTSNPVTMDPCDSWNSVSNDMLDQVVETLYAYDLTYPDLPLVGRLAESWYWLDNTSIEFKLRENVYFHDGSQLTADCVLHTFARINFFGNWTGTLDPDQYTMASPHHLYKLTDGIPIINDTLSFATGDYNVTLVLNRPYTPVEAILAYTASAIVHPDSTPGDKMLEMGFDLVIGTGPFKLMRYVPNSEVRFARWERYWRTGAYWDEIVYVYFRDAVTAYNAFCDGDIHWQLGPGGPRRKCQYYIDGLSDYINGTNYYFITIKSEWINCTWRKVICHAFNYTYLTDDIMEETVSKAHSLVPPGFPAYNSSVLGGKYDIPYARQLMQKMGYGYTGSVPWDIGSQIGDIFFPGEDENLWKAAEFIPDVGNFTNKDWRFYHDPVSHFSYLLVQRFIDDMDLIGIDVVPVAWTSDEFITRDEWLMILRSCHFLWASYLPNYIDTFNQIYSLVNPGLLLDIHKIDNAEINNLLALTLDETDSFQRYEYYKKLQYLIHDKYYYHMPLFYKKLFFVHRDRLKGVPYNCLNYLYWYPTYWE